MGPDHTTRMGGYVHAAALLIERPARSYRPQIPAICGLWGSVGVGLAGRWGTGRRPAPRSRMDRGLASFVKPS